MSGVDPLPQVDALHKPAFEATALLIFLGDAIYHLFLSDLPITPAALPHTEPVAHMIS